MAGRLKRALVLSLMVATLGAWGSALDADRGEKGNLTKLRKELASKGFIVQDGLMDFPPVVQWCCQCKVPSCYANNPSSPYGIVVLPPAPNQSTTVPNPYSEWFEEDGTYPAGFSMFWRMRPDEAVVFIGTTPPAMKYFGFTAYLYDRYHPFPPPPPPCKGDGITRAAPPSSYNRVPLFASLGDTVNDMTVQLNPGASDAFGRNVVFIVATDKKTESKVRHALMDAGYPKEILNTVVTSSQLARLGVENEKDTLTFVLRMATNDYPQEYIDSPRTILRVSPAQPVPAPSLDPLPLPKLRVRGTGKTEVSLLPAVDQLGKAIVAAYPDYTATVICTTNWSEGLNCIENEQNCLADNRDTPYIVPSFNPVTAGLDQAVILGPDDFLMAYGVNHAAAGKAVYSNVSVLGWTHKSSPVAVDNLEMPGSAAYFLGSTVDPDTANMLYAWKFTRPGGCPAGDTPSCRPVDTTCTAGVAADEPVALVFRAYVEKKTKVAPAYSEIVIDRVLLFTAKTR